MRGNLLQGHRDIDRLLAGLQTIAVLGIKPEIHASKPAHIVPSYLHRVGYDMLPVPVYYEDATEILGRQVYRRLADIPRRVDLVNVFRKPGDLAQHLPDMLKARPHAVWLQTGIRDDEFASQLLAAGIDVIQDECLMVEDRRWRSSR